MRRIEEELRARLRWLNSDPGESIPNWQKMPDNAKREYGFRPRLVVIDDIDALTRGTTDEDRNGDVEDIERIVKRMLRTGRAAGVRVVAVQTAPRATLDALSSFTVGQGVLQSANLQGTKEIHASYCAEWRSAREEHVATELLQGWTTDTIADAIRKAHTAMASRTK